VTNLLGMKREVCALDDRIVLASQQIAPKIVFIISGLKGPELL
jgi:hypothetical protein